MRDPCAVGRECGEAGKRSQAALWERVGFPMDRAKANKPRCRLLAAPHPSPCLTPPALGVHLAHAPVMEPHVGTP